MKVLLFSKNPCPGCVIVKYQLERAGVDVEVIEDSGRLYHLAQALGNVVKGLPAAVYFSTGNGAATDEFIKRVSGSVE